MNIPNNNNFYLTPLPSTSTTAEEELLEDFHCKIVLVGDCKCGKTSLIHQFVNEEFLDIYAPTIFERYSITFKATSHRVHCTIWDTSGTPGYDTVRPLAYPESHVFILCFTISDPSTLENIITKWHPEIRRYSQSTPLILCGCKSDLRNDCETISKLATNQRIPVTSEQGVAVGRQIGAVTYVETSSKTCLRAVQNAFEISALAALGKLNKMNSSGTNKLSNGIWNRSKFDLTFISGYKEKSRNCTLM